MNTLLDGDNITVASSGWPTVVTIAGAAAVVLAAGRRRWMAWLVAVVIAAGWLLIVRTRADGGELLPPLGVPVAALSARPCSPRPSRRSPALSERRRLRSLFARYVPPTCGRTARRIGPGSAASEGERVAVTALVLRPAGLHGHRRTARTDQDPRTAEPLLRGDVGRGVPPPRHRPAVHRRRGVRRVRRTRRDGSPRRRRTGPCAREMFHVLPALNSDLAELRLPHLNFGIGLHSATSWPPTSVRRSACSTRWSATRSTSPTATAASPPPARS